ncbi:MAG: hypothetical protein NZ927_05565 [Candidatus Calescibacterium sp.]|nr:hypothetical protein [Candidatus Calescibacterium sp.]MDW8086561.1 hypothetical protein [Candidatus Calescibacterium sp.]
MSLDIILLFLRESAYLLLFLIFFFSITFVWLITIKKESLSERLIHAFCYAFLQIYSTNFLLSVVSMKKPIAFVILNLVISLLIIPKKNLRSSETIKKFVSFFGSLSLSSKVALLLVSVSLVYVFIIAFFFPPTGTDDYGYRLPVIWENIRSGKLIRLNESCDPRMAFPQIPYTVFETYILISGSDRFVDFANIIFLLICANAVYYISRILGAQLQQSFLVSAFTFITPVFIGQLRSNYVDLAFAAFFISSFAFQFKIIKEKIKPSLLDITTASLYMGYLIGTKYTGLLFLPALEIILILHRKYFLVGNFVIVITSAPWYVLNLIDFGFPVYPNPFSELGKMIYPQGEDIFNPQVLWHRYIRIFLAFIKYDNLEISYHKGFGIFFWIFSLHTFLLFFVRSLRKKDLALFLTVSIFAPLIYMLWSALPTIHVQGRFFMWFVILTYPFSAIVGNRTAKILVLLLFILQFLTNFPKMPKTDQPLLAFNPIIETLKNKPQCTLYDRYFLKYSPWFEHYQKVSTLIQTVNINYQDPINIKCGYIKEGKLVESGCSFLFWGSIHKWETNNFSSCINSVNISDVLIISGEESDINKSDLTDKNKFTLLLSHKTKDIRGNAHTYTIYLRTELLDKLRKYLDESKECFQSE